MEQLFKLKALIEETDCEDDQMDALGIQEGGGSHGVQLECFECFHIWKGHSDTYHCPECGGSDIEPLIKGE